MMGLFLISAGLLLHTYLGYPLSLFLLRLVLGDRSRHRIAEGAPTVALVISAYNEEKVIRQKVENALLLDYPADKIRRIVVSDGSTDRTESIVREYEDRGVVLHAFSGRQGKVACLNRVVPMLRFDLVVMSDANSMYAPDSLKNLVRHFADPRVGCVCGELRYLNPRSLPAGEGERAYWGYEGLVKRLESSLGSLLGANGAIYAYRAGLFRPVDPLMFCDDVIPIRIAALGYLTLYDPQARCTEETPDEGAEIRRRIRHASFGVRSMTEVASDAARRGRLLLLYQCLSHRVARWLGGPALAGMLLGAPFLPHPWAVTALTLQALFYGAAALGFAVSRLGLRLLPLYLPYYFLAITVAGLAGLGSLAAGTDRPYWEPRQ
jgi:cellulose synthase/poly-beta-1,6-N-acetylglucosamine synthase-like glycosyltransferase